MDPGYHYLISHRYVGYSVMLMIASIFYVIYRL